MMMTQEAIQKLTGKRRFSAQLRWLQKNGWKVEVSSVGEPIVAVAEFHRRMVGGKLQREQPDWGAVNGTSAQA